MHIMHIIYVILCLLKNKNTFNIKISVAPSNVEQISVAQSIVFVKVNTIKSFLNVHFSFSSLFKMVAVGSPDSHKSV